MLFSKLTLKGNVIKLSGIAPIQGYVLCAFMSGGFTPADMLRPFRALCFQQG